MMGTKILKNKHLLFIKKHDISFVSYLLSKKTKITE